MQNEVRAARGNDAVEQHPDYASLDWREAASDTIADILHAAEAQGDRVDPYDFLMRALNTFHGDREDDRLLTA